MEKNTRDKKIMNDMVNYDEKNITVDKNIMNDMVNCDEKITSDTKIVNNLVTSVEKLFWRLKKCVRH